MTDQNKGWLSNIAVSIITSLVVLAGSWFTFQGDIRSSENKSEANRLQTAFERISYLETEMKEQQAKANTKIVELTTELFRLKSQLNKNLDVLGLFDDFMDSLPFEAWLKEVVRDEEGNVKFKMLLINNRYQLHHGVSDDRYQGSFDVEVWGEEISKRFKKSDLQALMSKSSVVRYTTYPVNPKVPYGKQERKLVVKIYLELIEGRQMIFGMAIDVPEELEQKE